MPPAPFENVLRYLFQASAMQGDCDLADRELLERFRRSRDESAFTFLVRRHGPLVYGVCKRLLGDAHEAEDAFQATFLVLVRRSTAIRRQDSLASWLYGVARRIATRARKKIATRRRHESEAVMKRTQRAAHVVSGLEGVAHEVSGPDLTQPELHTLLDTALASLAEKYRTPILLCYLQGKTYDQAAAELGCSKSTISRRMDRALELLRRKLQRHGLTISAAAVGTSLTEMASATPLPALLAVKTAQAAALLAADKQVAGVISAGALALMEEALAAMVFAKSKMAVLVVTLTLALGGASWAGFQALEGATNGEQPSKPEAQATGPEKQDLAGASGSKAPRVDAYGDPLPEGAVARLGTVRFRHNNMLNGVAFSPDGKLLASIASDEAVRLWDAETGKPYCELPMPLRGATWSLSFSPDGSKLVTAGPNKKVYLWDIATRKRLHELEGHLENVSAVVFSPDGKRVASAGGDIRIWDAATGREILGFKPEGKVIDGRQGLAFSPDGKLLAGTKGNNIYVWDADTGATRLVLPKAYVRTNIFAVFQNNNTLITSESGHVRFWDVMKGRQIREFNPKGTNYVASIALSKDRKLLARAWFKKIELLDIETGDVRQTFSDYYFSYGPAANHLTFSPDGKILAAMAEDNSIHIWDIETGKRRLTFDDAHAGAIRSATFSPDSRIVLTAGDEGTARLWNASSGKLLRIMSIHDEEAGVKAGEATAAFSPDGRWIVAGGFEDSPKKRFSGICRIWGTAASELYAQVRLPDRPKYVCFAPDSKTLAIATAESDHSKMSPVYTWDFLARVQPVKVADEEPGSWIEAIAFSSNAKNLLRVNKTAMHVSHMPAKRKQAFPFSFVVNNAQFSGDGNLLITGEWASEQSNRVRVLEVVTGRRIQTLEVPNTFGNHVAIAPNGRLAASCQIDFVSSEDAYDFSVLHVWNVETGVEVASFLTGSSGVRTLAFSNDSLGLVAGMGNGTALVWNLENMKGAEPRIFDAKEFERNWQELAGDDALAGQKATWRMMESPNKAIAYLQKKLQPVQRAEDARVQAWMVDLASDVFATRQSATKHLEQAGEQIIPALQKALAADNTLETRRRLEQILDTLSDVPPPETLRVIRAIMVLERIGSPEAQAVLETLAGGAPGARETEEAKASLDRLKWRTGLPKRNKRGD